MYPFQQGSAKKRYFVQVVSPFFLLTHRLLTYHVSLVVPQRNSFSCNGVLTGSNISVAGPVATHMG